MSLIAISVLTPVCNNIEDTFKEINTLHCVLNRYMGGLLSFLLIKLLDGT